ncbi:tRNA (guanosine(37)-N1)-methyltransferase TrmD, partial [Staphylococcus aureus]
PFGGGPGMVMQAGTLLATYREAQKKTGGSKRGIYLSPQGQVLTQKKIQELAQASSLILVCGRYEGVDERFIELSGVEEVSVGDFVASGGELPAMLLIDSV